MVDNSIYASKRKAMYNALNLFAVLPDKMLTIIRGTGPL
jgi:hypothetical protein